MSQTKQETEVKRHVEALYEPNQARN